MDEQAVKEYFLFDNADLKANQDGRLSEKQQEKMADLEKGSNVIIIALIIVFFGIASILPIVTLRFDLITLIWVLVWGGSGCYCLYSAFFNKSTSIAKVVVEKETGPVHFTSATNGSVNETEFTLHVGKVRLEVVSAEITDIIQKGDVFTVYYYALKDGTGNEVLSMERSPCKNG